jgi:hypothetical protein
MGGDVDVKHAARSMFHDHKDVENPKSGSRYYAEIAGDDGLGVMLEKS